MATRPQARFSPARRPTAVPIWCVRRTGNTVFYEGYRPQLFDLSNDPSELTDLGDHHDHAKVRECHRELPFDWLRGLKSRITVSDDSMVQRREAGFRNVGVIIGERRIR